MKKTLSILLAFILVFSAVPMSGIADFIKNIDFNFLSVKSSAASESDLTFTLNDDGNSYSVTDCEESASGELVIPSTHNGKPVTSIGGGAFSYCDSLTSITIPDSVTSIGNDAFYDCSNLISITIGNSVTNIGDWAFSYCSKLTSITIPDSVTSIGLWAFEDTAYYNNSSNWENMVLYIGNNLIKAKSSLSGAYTIKDSTKTIAPQAFDDCSNLTSITIPDSVTNIGGGAFQDCVGLTSITIPDSVTSINSSVFYGCKGLTNITIPDSVTNIGYEAFYGCSSLNSITIPDNVTGIGGAAFYKCSSLTSIAIPGIVTSIGSYAFYGCSSLTTITIPDSVEDLGSGTFNGCSSLTSINVGSDNTKYCSVDGILFSSDKTIIIHYPAGKSDTSYVIPHSVTSISDSAFYKCSCLISITIQENVTSIGDCAFYNCSKLTNITIPDSATHIGYSAFRGCDSLTSVTIGNSVTSIGYYAFEGCSSLISITIPDSVTSIGEDAFSDTAYYNNSSNWENGVFYIGNHLIEADEDIISGAYTIKDDTKTIANYAFYNCYKLTSITIPNSVTSIGDNAFSDCNSLKSVYITDLEKWCEISFSNSLSNPLCYCANLYINNVLVTNIQIPDTTTKINAYAFNYSSLTNITIGNSVTSIGDYAFFRCTSLTSITIPDRVTIIGDSAFYNCSSLTSITIPDSVMSIGNYAFYGCSKLTSITIPDSVTSIGIEAFCECSSLTSITIPDSVTSIYHSTFYNCSKLTSITIPDSVTSIGYCAFYGCNNLTIYGIADSYAQTYANANSINFVALDILPRYGKIDYTNKVYFCNKDKMSTAEDCLIFDSNYSHSVNKFNENEFLGTGSTVTVGENIYTVVITGDLDGDGVCDVLDALSAEKFANSQGDTPTTAQIYAANGDIAEEIDMSAYSNVVNQALSA